MFHFRRGPLGPHSWRINTTTLSPLRQAPVFLLVIAPAAMARPEIRPANFSGSETRINFDSLTGGGSLSTGDPVSSQYAAQGIVFSNGTRPMRANSFPSSNFAGHTLPNAVFVDQGGAGTPGVPPLNIDLSVPVKRIGLFICGSANASYTMKVYGASGLLETLTKPGVAVAAGTSSYLGLERSELITRVEVSCAGTLPFPYNFYFDDVQFEATGGGGECYANCDGSTNSPVLTANDFVCFLTAYSNAASYADCDGVGGLTANDFQCFLTRYASGCT